MVNSNSISQIQVVTPSEIRAKVPGGDVKSMARNFYNDMKGVMSAFANKEEPMTVNGVTLKGEDKYGTIGTTLLNQFMTDNGNAIETVMALEAFIMKLEQDISKAGA